MSLRETEIVLGEQISDKRHVKDPIPTEKYFLLLSAAVFNTSGICSPKPLLWVEKVVFVARVDVKTAALCSQHSLKAV